ncbi:alanine racemase [Aminiphilus sp.]|jgi:alanine racemase|uniref:alanine racemase n=1 Tax=Aminiphilus sp. TaxID=1872488 RepID=UPI001BCB2B72|nr:alanine racemase [Aminiphilus sp.]
MNWRPTRLEVNLNSIRTNYTRIRKHVGGARVIAVVKANAYNVGALPAAWALRSVGADFFAVATPDEALSLRDGGITDPVLVLGASPYDVAAEYVRSGIRAALTDTAMLHVLADAARQSGKPARVHLKVDTGLGRIGFRPDEALRVVDAVRSLPEVELEGIFTHFIASDSGDLTVTHEQYRIFVDLLKTIAAKGISIPMRHCCNSGGTLETPEYALDAVRPGHLLFGMYPTPEVKRAIPLEPCMEFKTAVAALRDLPPGSGVSYGSAYVTSGQERFAVLPLGYADGYYRELYTKGVEVLIRGKRCPVAGKICMDQTMVNVSHLDDVVVGDEVVLVGRQGEEMISLEEMAQKLGTLICVFPTLLGARVPRVYKD